MSRRHKPPRTRRPLRRPLRRPDLQPAGPDGAMEALNALSEGDAAALQQAIDLLYQAPHGPGMCAVVAIDPHKDTLGAVWLPTETAIGFLVEIGRGERWAPQLRAWPIDWSPLVVLLPSGSAVLGALPGGFGTMSAGGSA